MAVSRSPFLAPAVCAVAAWLGAASDILFGVGLGVEDIAECADGVGNEVDNLLLAVLGVTASIFGLFEGVFSGGGHNVGLSLVVGIFGGINTEASFDDFAGAAGDGVDNGSKGLEVRVFLG